MRRIDTRERRARLARRHHLAPGAHASEPVEAAADLVGLHATDPATVYLGAFARVKDLSIAALERALYEDRSLVRLLGMRATMFVVPVDLAAVIHAACGRANAAQQRRNTVRMIGEAGIAPDPGRWLAEVEAATLRALEARGEATANELSADVPRLREQIPIGAGKKWQGTIGISTRVLFLLAAEGRIVRGRPRGSWISSQYRWAPMRSWVPGGLAEVPTDAARVELVRRWLATFGPGTLVDLRWWTGWTLGDVRRALAEIRAVEVELDGEARTGLLLADDREPAGRPGPEPWVALLPALDPTVMGWAGREWFLGEHRRALFDSNGNAGPTVWLDGRVVGGWVQRADGEIAYQLLEDVGADARARIEAAAERVAAWLGPVRVTPRFRTPLEQRLRR